MKELIENYIIDKGIPDSVIVASKPDILLIQGIEALDKCQVIIKPQYPTNSIFLLYGRNKIEFKPEENKSKGKSAKNNK